MFRLFKKKKDDWQEIFEEQQKKFDTEILPIFQAVVAKLPDKYNHLKDRFNSSLLRGCKPNAIKGSGHLYVFLIDQFSHKKYETEKNNYWIQNIRLFSAVNSRWETLELLINNNIPTAFEFSTHDWTFDLTKIDTNKIKEFSYNDVTYQKRLEVIGDIPLEYVNHFDLKNGFEIELDNMKLFTIKEFGDGDYIAINENKEIYGLIHGKNLVEKLFDRPRDLYDALYKRQFDFKRYYESRT